MFEHVTGQKMPSREPLDAAEGQRSTHMSNAVPKDDTRRVCPAIGVDGAAIAYYAKACPGLPLTSSSIED